jgi:hypothetical protein
MRLLRRVLLTQDRKRPQDLIPKGDASGGPAPESGATNVSAGHGAGLWACQDLNLGPHPYQQNARNRCATRRSPRSRPTVEAEVMCSHRVQLSALIVRLSSLLPTDRLLWASISRCSFATSSPAGAVVSVPPVWSRQRSRQSPNRTRPPRRSESWRRHVLRTPHHRAPTVPSTARYAQRPRIRRSPSRNNEIGSGLPEESVN